LGIPSMNTIPHVPPNVLLEDHKRGMMHVDLLHSIRYALEGQPMEVSATEVRDKDA